MCEFPAGILYITQPRRYIFHYLGAPRWVACAHLCAPTAADAIVSTKRVTFRVFDPIETNDDDDGDEFKELYTKVRVLSFLRGFLWIIVVFACASICREKGILFHPNVDSFPIIIQAYVCPHYIYNTHSSEASCLRNAPLFSSPLIAPFRKRHTLSL